MELGRLGETEAMYTLIVSGSMLLWHWGDRDGWHPAVSWGIGYSLAACAMLAKGPQGPAYFIFPIWSWLILNGRWRELVTWSHLFGITVSLLIWNAWQIPYLLEMGWESTIRMYRNDIAMRFEDPQRYQTIRHLVQFPAEILVCLLPWSPIVTVYASKTFRVALNSLSDHVKFLAWCIAITFPTVWFIPGAHTRYFLPLFPAFALLTGIAIQTCWSQNKWRWWTNSWGRLVRGVAIGAFTFAILLPLMSWIPKLAIYALSPGMVAIYSTSLIVLASFGWKTANSKSDGGRRVAALAVAASLGMIYMGPVLEILNNASNDTDQQIIKLKETLPPGTELVSLGLVEHVFPFYFRSPIRVVTAEELVSQQADGTKYFCFSKHNVSRREFPFKWTPVVEITCDRTSLEPPQDVVVVGRIIKK